MKTIRVQITDTYNNATYLTVNAGKVVYMARNEEPLALVTISENAARLRFDLEDARTEAEVRNALKTWVKAGYKFEVIPPKSNVYYLGRVPRVVNE